MGQIHLIKYLRHVSEREADRRRAVVKEALYVTLEPTGRELARRLFERDYLDRSEFAILSFAERVGEQLQLDQETVLRLRRQLAKYLLR